VHKKKLSSKEAAEAIDRDQVLMSKLLDQIVELEQELAKKGEDITLIVTSDHGLIETGHGGASPEEKQSLIFAYSSRGFAANQEAFSFEKDI
jgi:predicted AlkP superfamily pyrophosphatase or phosphodiesterase